MLIDTHAHLNFKAFDKDRDEVIKRCLENDVWVINASSNYETSKLSCELAEKYPQGVFASVGLHPIHVKDEEFDVSKYRELAKSEKVVAIGETGLDYMYSQQEKQKQVFLEHLALAKELNLPVIFHCRKAHNDMIEILRGQSDFRGVVHCFTGTWEQAEEYLDMGLYLGFNGIIFKFNIDEIIKKTPLDRMLVETDCPFLIPPGLPKELSSFQQQEGAKLLPDRNEPIYVKYVAQKIAEIRNEPLEKVTEATTRNAKKLFNFS